MRKDVQIQILISKALSIEFTNVVNDWNDKKE
jgi:hypothetical protein